MKPENLLVGLLLAAFVPTVVALALFRPTALASAILIASSLAAAAVTRFALRTAITSHDQSKPTATACTVSHPRRRDPDRLVDQLVPAIEECLERKEQEADRELDIRTELYSCVRSVLDGSVTAPLGGEAKYVTVLLSDLRGFTVITETYAAREVVDMLNRYFERMCQIIYKHGGTVDKFMGDSIMALFGAPVAKPDDVIQAVSCAVEMQLAMDAFNTENENLGMPCLYMGIGVNTGQVVAGKIGSDLHSEYTVIGNEVNLASRIEAYTLRGQILISQNTYSRLKDFISVKDPIYVSVKGKREAVPLYELLAVNEPYNLKVPEREVRRSLRVDVTMPFQFNICEGKVISSDVFDGHILNISAGGMFACTEQEVEPFFNIAFKLQVEAMGLDTETIYGKILRVKKAGNLFEMNVEFTIIEPNDRENLKALVSKLVQGDFSAI